MTLSGEIKELNKISNPQFKIPNSLAAVAMKALSTKKQDRYSNIDELRSDIIKWREGFATEAENASIVQLLKLLIKRNKILSSLVFFFIIASFIFIYQIRTSELEAIEQKTC